MFTASGMSVNPSALKLSSISPALRSTTGHNRVRGTGTSTSSSSSTSTTSTGTGTTSTGTSTSSTGAGTTSTTSSAACTLYVASNGSTSNSGTTPTSAITLLQAADVAVAGDVVCIEPGSYSLTSTFAPRNSGNANAWITYTNYNGGVVDIVWTAGANASDQNMFHMYSATFPDGPSYITFEGLTLDGQNIAENGFFCQNSHHLRYLQNTIINQGSAGIGSVKCDYQTADHNVIFHNGYKGGWSSGISYNSNQFYDTYTGLHNVVSNNIIAAEFDGSSNHTDGNGIIMDLSNGQYQPGTTPPDLIVNNVVYGNGGRCIENNYVSNSWVVNNTCYDNNLDLTLGKVGSISNISTSASFYVNNISSSWNGEWPFYQGGTASTGLTYANNLIYGGTNSGTASTGFTTGNPDFVSPLSYNATAGGQYANTINPGTLGNDLQLTSSSPAINAGIDPTTLTTNSSLQSDMGVYIYMDILGNSRPHGGPFTLGAYNAP